MRFARLIFVCVSLILLVLVGILGLVRQQEPQPPYIFFQYNTPNDLGIYRITADGRQVKRIINPQNPTQCKASPLGDWLLCFNQYGELYIVNPQGKRRKVLMTDEAFTGVPIISSDGQWIIMQKQLTGYSFFKFNIAQQEKINLRIIDGTTEPPLPHESEFLTVVYINGNREIYKGQDNGSYLLNLTQNPFEDLQPIWSPNGQWIVFLSDRDNDWAFYRMRADGTQLNKLITIYPYNVDFHHLAWSPNGKLIAFSYLGEEGFEIYIVNPNDSNSYSIDPTPKSDNFLEWSSDGKWILFSPEYNGQYDIYKMQLDGSNITHLISNSSNAQWSPIIDMEWRGERLLLMGLGLLALVGVSYRFRQ